MSDQFLTKDEQHIFDAHLEVYGLDRGIWEVFAALFDAGVKHTQPLLVRIFHGRELHGALIITRCSNYGKALFKSRFLSGMINLFRIPYFQWIRIGCCIDMMSNPGFARDPQHAQEIYNEGINFLKLKGVLTIINDYSDNCNSFPGSSILPALPHALIDCSEYTSVQDYLDRFKNMKRKLKVFHNKGGIYVRIDGNLSEEQLVSLKDCFISTSRKSVFYLPYQDLYLNAALVTSARKMENAVYFVAMLNGQIIGYQAALRTGQYLNAMHGAFNRNLKTTHHAYDILFVKMTEYAIEHGLRICDYGAVLNHTKEKMVNKTHDLSYFIYSRYAIVQWIFRLLLKTTKIQGRKQMKFLRPGDAARK